MTERGLAGEDTRGDLITGGVASRERDIDVVLVTGAGASRAFGVNGKPMPLMGDWSDGFTGSRRHVVRVIVHLRRCNSDRWNRGCHLAMVASAGLQDGGDQ